MRCSPSIAPTDVTFIWCRKISARAGCAWREIDEAHADLPITSIIVLTAVVYDARIIEAAGRREEAVTDCRVGDGSVRFVHSIFDPSIITT
jgi:hypothetical protein